MSAFSSLVGDFLETCLGSLTWFCSLVVTGVYKLFYFLFDIFISPLKSLFNDNVSGIGSDFFDFLFGQAEDHSYSFNLIYWVVGICLFFFCFKRVILPLCITIIDKIASLITPGA